MRDHAVMRPRARCQAHPCLRADPSRVQQLVRSATPWSGGESAGRVELTAACGRAARLGLDCHVTLAPRRSPYPVLAIVPLRVLDRSLGELTAAGEAAKKQHMLLYTALGNMVQGLAMFDADERIVIANNQYAEIYGLPPSQVRPGATLREIADLRAAQGIPGMNADEAYQLLRSRTECTEPTHVLYKVGERPCRGGTSSSPGRAGGWVVTHEDVTERESLHALLTSRTRCCGREEQLKGAEPSARRRSAEEPQRSRACWMPPSTT